MDIGSSIERLQKIASIAAYIAITVVAAIGTVAITIYGLHHIDVDLWVKYTDIFGNLATGAAAIIITVTLLVYILQLRTARKFNQLHSLLTILQYIDNPDLRRVRWFMYEHANAINPLLDGRFDEEKKRMLDKEIKELSEADGRGEVTLEDVDSLPKALDHIAYLILSGYAPYHVVPNLLRNLFLRTDESFRKFIAYRQQNRGTFINEDSYAMKFRSQYARHFDDLIERIKHTSKPEKR